MILLEDNFISTELSDIYSYYFCILNDPERKAIYLGCLKSS